MGMIWLESILWCAVEIAQSMSQQALHSWLRCIANYPWIPMQYVFSDDSLRFPLIYNEQCKCSFSDEGVTTDQFRMPAYFIRFPFYNPPAVTHTSPWWLSTLWFWADPGICPAGWKPAQPGRRQPVLSGSNGLRLKQAAQHEICWLAAMTGVDRMVPVTQNAHDHCQWPCVTSALFTGLRGSICISALGQ